MLLKSRQDIQIPSRDVLSYSVRPYGWGKLMTLFGFVKASSVVRAAQVHASVEARAGPSVNKLRLALARLGAPVATRLASAYPALPLR
jgi:hypothetical protein